MRFVVCGPYPLQRNDHGINTERDKKRLFWEVCESDKQGLSNASGCYIFALKTGRGILPWYIGKAEKLTFKDETFSPQKLLTYNKTCRERKGTPLMYFIPNVTPAGKLCRPTKRPRAVISFLETMLIGYAYRRNKNLKNVSNTKFLKELEVVGLIRSRGRPGIAAQNLRLALAL